VITHTFHSTKFPLPKASVKTFIFQDERHIHHKQLSSPTMFSLNAKIFPAFYTEDYTCPVKQNYRSTWEFWLEGFLRYISISQSIWMNSSVLILNNYFISS